VPLNSFEPGAELRLRPASKQPCRRNLALLFTGALLALFVAASGKAGAVENGAAPPSSHVEGSAQAELFVEDPSQGQQYAGSVTWHIDRSKVVERPDEVVVHADVEIPGRMTMKLDFKPNADPSLPASHIMELTFVMPRDVAGDEVIAVPGLLMKYTARTQGVPFISRTTKVAKGSS